MIRALFILLISASPLAALDLALPNATVTREQTSPAGSVRLPEKPWAPGTTPPIIEGAIRQQAMRLANSSRTTLQLIDPLRTTLADLGYTEIFTCADASCGGFDFRFQLDLLGEPDMHVDLGDYRYLLMRKAGETTEPHSVSIVASRTQTTGFVHITEVSDAIFPEESAVSAPQPELPEVSTPTGGTIERMLETGSAVLSDLDFTTGSSELGAGPHTSLANLAAWLAANPSARIILVGHTDAVGSLEANTALSRRRAQSVASRLTGAHGVTPAQIQAEGAGYLSPRAPNLTEEGRAANRRVEVVLLEN